MSTSVANINQFFATKTAQRGRSYFRKGAVKSWNYVNPEELSGTVEGSYSSLYEVSIAIKYSNGATQDIDACCTCPVTFNCKHAYAVLLAANALDKDQATGPSKNLDPEWSSWLRSIQPPQYSPEIEPYGTLVYVLNETTYGKRPILEVSLGLSKTLKSGKLGKPQHISTDSVNWARHADELDVQLAHNIKKHSINSYRTFYLEPKHASSVLKDLILTKRTFWQKHQNENLQLGQPVQVTPKWEILQSGDQTLKLIDSPSVVILPTSPPWYINEKTSECGLLETDLPPHLFPAILQMPTAKTNQVPLIHEAIQKLIPTAQALLPKEIVYKEKTVAPTPILVLYGTKQLLKWNERGDYALMKIIMSYDGHRVPFESHEPCIKYVEDETTTVSIKRDISQEETYINQLLSFDSTIPLTELYDSYDLKKNVKFSFAIGGLDWKHSFQSAALTQIVPNLQSKGWKIEIDDSFPFDWVNSEQSDWFLDIEDGPQMQWFELSVGLDIDGEKINILPSIVKIIELYPDFTQSHKEHAINPNTLISIRLSDGRFCTIKYGSIQKIIDTLIELQDPNILKDDKLSIPRLRAPELLDILEEDHLKTKDLTAFKDLAQQLKNFNGLRPITCPSAFKAELRPYQEEGLSWLQFISEFKMGGILADDMGLGKTVQALAHLTNEHQKKPKKPSLIIAPTSVISNWMQESSRFTPHLKTLLLHGPDRHSLFQQIPTHDLVLTTYPLLNRDEKELLRYEYHSMILDEAQTIKNPRSKVSKICRLFSADHRIALTGTPMENHLGELWSIFDFLNPQLLGNEKQFRSLFQRPIEKHNRVDIQDRMRKRISPFILRRTKSQVVLELPPKTEMIRTIELSGKQRDLYEGIRLAMHKRVKNALEKKGLASSQIIILDALLKLRQTCCDPSLLKLDSAKGVKESSKLNELEKMLEQLISEKRKILIFSSFTSMLQIIENLIIKKDYTYVKLTGQTKNRSSVIKTFQETDTSIFLISLKAGGVGLNLTAADTVIHYDPWWNPAAENQATDRAYRIGQDKPVFVYKLITKNTVEEKILKLQEKKKALISGLFDESTESKAGLSQEDLDYLFEPLK